jgi:hypothetical protein
LGPPLCGSLLTQISQGLIEAGGSMTLVVINRRSRRVDMLRPGAGKGIIQGGM